MLPLSTTVFHIQASDMPEIVIDILESVSSTSSPDFGSCLYDLLIT